MRAFAFMMQMVVLVLSVLSAPFVKAAERGIIAVPVKNAGGQEVLLYRESHALLVGVSQYGPGWPKLPGVLEDLREVRQVLEAQGFNVVEVRDPTRRQMEDAYTGFINKYGRGKDNRLLFYFAGHGHTQKLEYGGDMGYIVPADAPDPNRDLDGFLSKAVSMQMFEVYAKTAGAKHALFLFDSCFSGALFALSRATPEVIQAKTSQPVRQFITAGTAEQTVPDRSIFRDQLVRALRGEADLNHDEYVTASELGQFLEATVTNYSRNAQTPLYGKLRDPNLDKGDFVFSLKALTEITSAEHIAAEKERVKALQQRVEEQKREVELERQGLAEAQRLAEEKQRLEAENRRMAEEKQRLAAEREKLARLEPPKGSKGAPAGMVKILGGDYVAGLAKELGGDSDETPHRETVRSFSMDQYEVTQGDFQRVMGSNPSEFKGNNLPVDSVTWHEAVEYCRKVGKRLPTEWEWEYAAKGGSNTKYAWGDNGDQIGAYAWFSGNSGNTTHPVGQKEPNQYGLYDMAGNVWEWTASDYDGSGKYRVLRGGSWDFLASSARPANRGTGVPGVRGFNFGFRCAQ